MGNVTASGWVAENVLVELSIIVEKAELRSGVLLPDIIVQTDCSFRKSPRNFAAVKTTKTLARPVIMLVCEDFAAQPITRIRGVLWHEIGHILDALLWKQKWRRRAGLWGFDDEQCADAAVEHLCHVKLFYDNDLVQRAGPGAFGTRPRPMGLH